MDEFKNRLQKAMNSKGIKAKELSDKTGISESLISSYLSGRYKANQIRLTQIAEVLEVTEPWLMGFDVEKSSNIKELTADELYQEVQKLVSNSTLSDKDKDKIMSDIGYICEKD